MAALTGCGESSFTQKWLSIVQKDYPFLETIDEDKLFFSLRDIVQPRVRSRTPTDRFSNVLPPIYTIVKIAEKVSFNGNFVSLVEGRTFIATQTPQMGFEDFTSKEKLFWRAVIQTCPSAVVNLTAKGEQCDGYVSQELNTTLIRGCESGKGFLDSMTEKTDAKFYVSSLHTVQQVGTEETVSFEYVKVKDWRDQQGISVECLASLVEKIESFHVTHPQRPVLVHCRAGIGRTGTLIVASAIKVFAEMGKLHSENYKTYISALVLAAREQRGVGTVQTIKQFRLLVEYAQSFFGEDRKS